MGSNSYMFCSTLQSTVQLLTLCNGSKGLSQLSRQLETFTALAKIYREYLSLCEEVVLLQWHVLEEQTRLRHIF